MQKRLEYDHGFIDRLYLLHLINNIDENDYNNIWEIMIKK
jgi:hypothetical protein